MIMYDYNPYYNTYYRRYGHNYNNIFNKYYNPTYSTNKVNVEKENINTILNNTQTNQTNDNQKESNSRLEQTPIEDDTINLFGFSFAIDDLIILTIIVLLFLQSNKDYALLIVLGLMLFNINFSNLDIF